MDGRQPLELRVQLEVRDYLWTAYWLNFRTPGMIGLALLSLFLPVMGTLSIVAAAREFNRYYLLFLCLTFLPGLLLFGSIFVRVKWYVARNPALREPGSVRISDRGIDYLTASWTGELGWPTIIQI